ncbi:MAG TPA: M20/M25/M40 family metallo-hydrolase [Thermoanaerobaculia bacterium]|jgi:acetylornithine deacetylase/succinyl-diaminopimelate desuccinylase-like protein
MSVPLLALPLALLAAGPGGGDVRAWRSAHEVEIVRELAGLLAIPNVASDASNIERNAEAIRAAYARRGIAMELLRAPGAPPAVFGELRVPGAARTIVFYAHYDGQPVVLSQWTGEPWKPVLRDKALRDGGREIPWEGLQPPLGPEWRVYARSASDDKAPIVGLLAALDALAASGRTPAANLKFFFEGEEEAGSPHLEQILRAHADRLRGDLWLLLDGPVHQTRRMALYFGARGVTDVEMTVYGPSRPLHSGHYGNWAVNPIAELVRLLGSMRDDEGRILVAGFADGVRPATAAEKRALAAVPPVETELAHELALGRTEGEGAPLAAQILRPALNFRGIAGGGVGASATNAIPTEARASIDFRLVPDQTPEKVRVAVEEHVRKQGFTVVHEDPTPDERRASPRIVKLVWGPGYPAARAPLDAPSSRAVIATVEEAAGPTVLLPTLGGSIPMYLFGAVLKTPVIGVPIVNHDNDQHAANENLRLQNLWDGIEVYAALMSRLPAHWDAAPTPK